MKVLVTGGGGFIGSHTVDRLLSEGHEVIVIDALRPPVHQNGKPGYLSDDVEFHHGDVRDRELMTSLLRRVDAVYHLAAYQDYLPDFSTFFDINVTGTALLYEIAAEHQLDLNRVVVASSQAVLGEGLYRCEEHGEFCPDIRSTVQLEAAQWDIPCPTCGREAKSCDTDERVHHPQNPYGMSKYAQEMVALNLGKRYGIDTVAMRYSIVQGPRQSVRNAYSGACRIFCLSYQIDQLPPVYEDGLARRDFVNIQDVVDANLLVLTHPDAVGRCFNVGGGKAYTVLEFAEIVRQVYESSKKAVPTGLYRFGDTRHIVSDISNLRGLGWQPKRSAIESVRDYAEWLNTLDDIDSILDGTMKKMEALNVVRKVGR